jgi:predicted transposase YdaD
VQPRASLGNQDWMAKNLTISAPHSEERTRAAAWSRHGTEKRRSRQIQSSVQKQHGKAARLRQPQKLELFQTIQRMKSSGMKVSQIAGHLGIDRGRIDRWVRLDTLPERNRMEPRPGMMERFRGHLL